jgi:hypothetical protein
MGQKQLLFHYDPVLAPNPSLPAAPTIEECIALIDSNNPASPFNSYVGQEFAKKKMARERALISFPRDIIRVL